MRVNLTITNQLCIEITEMVSTISDHKSAINPMEICNFSIFLSVKAPFFRWFRAGGHDKAMTMVVSPRRWRRMSGSWARHVSPSRARERGAVRENGAGFFRRFVTNWLIYVFFSPWFMLFFHPGLRPSETWPSQWWLSYKLVICSWLIFDDICFFMTFKLLTNGRSYIYICHPIFSALV